MDDAHWSLPHSSLFSCLPNAPHDDLPLFDHHDEPLLCVLDAPFDDTLPSNTTESFDDEHEAYMPGMSGFLNADLHAVEDTTSGSCSSHGSVHGSDDVTLSVSKPSSIDSPPALSKVKQAKSVSPPASERDSHNAMERMRRVNIRQCFESLQNSLPDLCTKKTHSLNVLQEAARYIQYLRAQACVVWQ